MDGLFKRDGYDSMSVTDNRLALGCAILIVLLAVVAFPAFLFLAIRRGRSRKDEYGSISGMLMQGRVTRTFGESPGWSSTGLVRPMFRVVGVQAERAAVGLEFRASGPGFMVVWPIALSPEEADAVADWLDRAAAGDEGTPPGAGFWLYRATVFAGARISGLHGGIEKVIGRMRWRMHVVSVGSPEAHVGVGIRGTLAPWSDRVRGSRLTPASARALAGHLRQAAEAARSAEPPKVEVQSS